MSAYTKPISLSFSEILRRTALPFFLFSAVLAALLLLSWFALIPELSEVLIAGEKRGIRELRAYRGDLVAKIVVAELQRDEFLMPVRDPAYVRLRQEKQKSPEVLALRREIGRIAKTVYPEAGDAVAISQFSVDVGAKRVKVNGEVRNVGPRSMTVLAEFIDGLRELPGIVNVGISKYTRKENPDYGFFSPFSIEISLHE